VNFVKSLLLLALGCTSLSATALNWVSPAPVIKVTHKSPLFEKASSTSNTLGEADPETPVLARALSPKSTWLLVEDSDGNRAWIPTSRSNFNQIKLLNDTILPNFQQKGPYALAEEAAAKNPQPVTPIAPVKEGRRVDSPKRVELGAGWMRGFTGRPEGHADQLPLSLAYMELGNGGDRMGFRLSYDPLEVRAFQANFVARYAWGGSGLFREFDAGYEKQWMSKQDASKSALNMGYSMGFYLGAALSIALRGGLFLGGRSQWNGGVFLRCFVY